jgi:asparagine synthase (glutamine-hydrolysing)
MFAFALWDGRRKDLWLVRDRIGVKPLYYSVHHGRLTFASEIKALLKDPEQERRVDEEALFHFLSFLTPPAPNTLFAGIHKLPAGSWLRVRSDGSIQERKYWDALDDITPLSQVGDVELAERLLDELRESVRLRSVSDVPVGVFLSGGIDSSTNAKLFSEAGQTVRTFTVGYDADYGSNPNETAPAREMAALLGAEHHERHLSVDDLLDFLPRMVRLQDEPIADPVCVPLYYVSALAREAGVTVCQLGEGADELFCGYPGWARMLSVQRWNRYPGAGAVRPAAMAALRLMGREGSWPYERLRRAERGQPVFWGGAEAFTQAEKEQLLSPRLRERFAGRSSWEVIEPIWGRFHERAWETDPLNWMTYLDLNLRLPELLLMRVDKMSMGVSLEGRVPFLDHEVVRLAMSMPAAAKIRDGQLKSVLKRAVRGIIPDTVIDRKKQGFGVPVHEWFMGTLGEITRTEVRHLLKETDFFDPAGVEALLASGRGAQVWYLLNFALWWREYVA